MHAEPFIFETKSWRAYRDLIKEDLGLAQVLEQGHRRQQETFNALMVYTRGDPVGLEIRHPLRAIWAFISPAPDSGYRVTYFDERFFVSHRDVKDPADALEDLVAEGFAIPDRGALDRCSRTACWNEALKLEAARFATEYVTT